MESLMSRFFRVTPLLFVLPFCGCSHSRFDPTVEGPKLLQRDADWSKAAYEGKDVEKIISYWADDAKVIEPQESIYQGKDAIRKFVTESLKTPGFKIRWTGQAPVFSPDGKMAYMSENAETTAPDPKGGLVTFQSRGITVWRLDPDGEWRCVIDISNEGPPAKP